MKKISTLLIAATFAVSAVTAQDLKVTQGKGKYPQASYHAAQSTSSNKGGVSASSAVIFSEDFASGIPATWAIVDNIGNGEIWTYGNGPAGPSAIPGDTLMSPTAANGFAIMDDDFYGNDSTLANTDLITPAFSCAGNMVVRVSFFDYFRMFNVGIDLGHLHVSTDSVTWTDVYQVETGLAANIATANPHVVDFDISAIAANQATVYLKFNYQGDWGYFWQVDDISVYEPAAVDGGVSAITGLVSGCGLSATTPITVDITNFGVNAISGFPVSYTINGGTAVTETYSAAINGGATASYTFTATADFSAPNTYAIVASTGIAGDGNAANDASNISIVNSAPTSVTLVTPFSEGFETATGVTPPAGWTMEDTDGDGNAWDFATTFPHTGLVCARVPFPNLVPAENWLFTPCLDLATGTNYQIEYWYKSFDITQTSFELESRFGTSATSIAMTNNIAVEPLFPDSSYHYASHPFSVSANGSYYVGLNGFSAAPTGSLRVDDVLITIITGINDNPVSSYVNIYPNPTSDVINITSKIQGNVIVQLFNAMGQQVHSSNFNQPFKTVVDVSHFAQGVYTVKLSTDNGTVVKKVVLQNN